jgi:hypothetical protein
MLTDTVHTLLAELKGAFTPEHLVKATLSKPTFARQPDLKNLYLKPVLMKGSWFVACNFRYQQRDEVKNIAFKDILAYLEQWLSTDFREASIFTHDQEINIRANRKGTYELHRKTAQTVTKVTTENNREKKRLIDQNAPWLRDLGITTANAEVRADAQDKWRQMNKYVEIIGVLLDSTPLTANARIVDMGSGKGYLTFALAAYLKKKYDFEVQVLGVELREPLVAFCNQVVKHNSIDNLSFVAKDIAMVQEQKIDMLIALHACDTATDLALLAGIKSKSKIVVVAPCCHKQVRKDMHGTPPVQSILSHGIMLERQAEIVTDTIRSLILETEGYKTKVFEFISLEHTPKNIMITAEKRSVKTDQVAKAKAQIADLKQTFGVKQHYLEELILGGK